MSFFLLYASCQRDEQDNSGFKFKANIEEIQDTVQFQDIVDNYRLIPLETSPDCKIGDIKELIVKDSLIYVVSDGVYCFNKDGVQRFAINKKGHAQNEYTVVYSANVADGNIYIYDAAQKKVIVFDGINGTFKKKIDIPYLVGQLFCNEKFSLADRRTLESTAVPNDERFFVFSNDNPENIIHAFLPEEENKTSIVGVTTMNEDGFFFSNYYRFQTWKIDDDSCKPYLQVVLPSENAMGEEQLASLIESKQPSTEELRNSDKAWGLTYVYDNDHNITGQFSFRKNFTTFVFNKDTKKCVAYRSVKTEGPWQPSPMGFKCGSQDKMYSVITAGAIAFVKGINNLPTIPKEEVKSSDPYSIYCSITEEDNPVVVEYTLK